MSINPARSDPTKWPNMPGFPIVGRALGRSPHHPKTWFIPQPQQIGMSPQYFAPKNTAFAIFMQFLVILVKMSPPPREA